MRRKVNFLRNCCSFLSFLYILVFANITERIVEAQDIFSVLAFAVTLLSNLLGTIQTGKIEEDTIKSQEAKQSYEECRVKLKEMTEME